MVLRVSNVGLFTYIAHIRPSKRMREKQQQKKQHTNTKCTKSMRAYFLFHPNNSLTLIEFVMSESNTPHSYMHLSLIVLHSKCNPLKMYHYFYGLQRPNNYKQLLQTPRPILNTRRKHHQNRSDKS